MNQIRKRTALLAAAALCWGIMFPEYTFTTDSYTAFVQEAPGVPGEGISAAPGPGTLDDAQTQEKIEELFEAVRAGKVRYRFRIYEYLKDHLFGA